jgi:tetrahydromethanopterin S-methyltransferase subunit G
MDPLTLFALANGAVSAVKAGCKLYKDIKGAAGEVKEVLKDLDEQFRKLHPPEKPPTVEQKQQFLQEKERVKELNKKANDGTHTGIYQEIGEKLGEYYDNFYKCMAIMEEEERRAETEVYTGDASLGKRALQRVLMRKQLEQMSKDLRELMVYQSPPELGALYTEVEAMMKHMGETQRVLISKQMQRDHARARRIKKRIEKLWLEAAWGVGAVLLAATFGLAIAMVVEDRIKKYPHLGDGWIPKTEEQRRRDAEPKIYIGR